MKCWDASTPILLRVGVCSCLPSPHAARARAGYRAGQSLYISYNPGGGWNDYNKSSPYLNTTLLHSFDGNVENSQGAVSILLTSLTRGRFYTVGKTGIIISFDSVTDGAATVVVRQQGGLPCGGV